MKTNSGECLFFSIVTVNYNNADGLRRTLESVRLQGFCNYELIVIDGGSTDGSLAVLSEFDDVVSTLVSEPDRGISHAFNKGTALCVGEWVNYLNSGDVYLDSNVLALVEAGLTEGNSCEWCYGLRKRVDANGDVFSARSNEKIPYSYSALTKGRLLISHQAAFFKRVSLLQGGGYDEEYQFLCMDYDLMLRFAIKGPPLVFNDYLVVYDVTGVSARYLYASLMLKHKIRCTHKSFGLLRVVSDYFKTNIMYINGLLRKTLKKFFMWMGVDVNRF